MSIPQPSFQVVTALGHIWDVPTLDWVRDTGGGGAAGGDLVLVSPDDPAVKASVRSYGGGNPLAVALTDTFGNTYVSGGGTQYAEDATTAPATGTVALGRHADGRLVPIPIDETNVVPVSLSSSLPVGVNALGSVKVTQDPSYTETFEWDGSGVNPIYIGCALQGSSKASALWQIRKLTYDGANNPTDVQYANGSPLFNAIWNNRAALSYS